MTFATIIRQLGRGWLFLCYFSVLIVWTLGLLFRANLVDQRIGPLVGCEDCFQLAIYRADSPVLLFGTVLMGLSLVIRWAVPALLLRFLVVLLTLLYLLDIYIFEVFNSRLYASDVSRYFEFEVLRSYIVGAISEIPYADWYSGLGLILLSGFLFFRIKGWPRRAMQYCAVLAIFCCAAGLLIEPVSYVHSWTTDNVIVLNQASGEATPYGDDMRQEVLQAKPGVPGTICEESEGTSPNIVLVIIESWSSWQSQYFSGLNNWTPRLDKLAREHTANTDFFANGFTTNDGLIALLTGRQPLPAVTEYNAQTPFQNFWNLPATLPKSLAQRGYQSIFLTSGDLAFSDKRSWLENLGFNYIEGHDHPGYAGQKRFVFDSVADAILYSRALELTVGDPMTQRFASLWPGKLPTVTAGDKPIPALSANNASFPFNLDLLSQLTQSPDEAAFINAKAQFREGDLYLSSFNIDPIITMPSMELPGGRDYQLDVTLHVTEPTKAQLFYSEGEAAPFIEDYSETRALKPGENQLTWSFRIQSPPGKIRIDPGEMVGEYRISSMQLRSEAYAVADDTPLETDKPYLMVIETVSTHHPYIDPMTRTHSAPEAFGYADATAGVFYEALRDSGFFENGILIITSDHRSMTPLALSEVEHFGRSAHARIPLIVIAPVLSNADISQGSYQQRDVPTSLLQLVPGSSCQTDETGNLFAKPPRSPRCILVHRGDHRDYVDAFCGEQEGTIRLDGDRTRLIDGELHESPRLIESINSQRIRGSQHQRSD